MIRNTHTHMHACAQLIQACANMHPHTSMHICTHIHVHNLYKYLHIHTCMHACIYTHNYVYNFLFVGDTSHSAIQACLELIVYSKLTSSSQRFSCSAFQILKLQAWGTMPVWSFPFHGPVAFFIFKLVGNCNLFIIHSLSPLQASGRCSPGFPFDKQKMRPRSGNAHSSTVQICYEKIGFHLLTARTPWACNTNLGWNHLGPPAFLAPS